MDRLETYRALCASKRPKLMAGGIMRTPELNATLRDHQRHGVEFALRAGRSALFYDTGLGKTRMMLDWGRCVVEHTNKPVLMLAPLAVGAQHLREANTMGVDAAISRFGAPPSSPKVVITNYERLERFDPNDYAGVILDESSILKSFSGATSKKLITAFSQTPFRLLGSATPAPNDHTELGQSSEFLSALSRTMMLTRFFLHDSADTGEWRLKGHAVRHFWDWVASWARCVSKPSDLGFDDTGYDLPPFNIKRHIIESDRSIDPGADRDGQQRLFRMPENSATSIHKEKRMTAPGRSEKAAEIVASIGKDEPICIWVDTDYEAEAIRAVVPDAVEVSGKMSVEMKEERLDGFSKGDIRILLVKPSIAGYGLNWQHCNQSIFVGLSFSYEAFYQSVRRFYRFGQKRPVNAHIVMADTEAAIADIVHRKAGDHDKMKSEMAEGLRLRLRSGSEKPEGRWHFKEGPGSNPRAFLLAPGNP